MGCDEYWPTSIATLSVACVPASFIAQTRFNEITRRLANVREVPIVDLDLPSDFEHDLIFSPAFKEGSILFDFSASLTTPKSSAVPPGADERPQVVLGIYDASHPSLSRDVTFGQVRKDLESKHARPLGGPVCLLVVFDTEEEVNSHSTLFLPNLEDSTVRQLVRDVALSVIRSHRTTSTELADKELVESSARSSGPQQVNGDRSPQAVLSAEHGASPQTQPNDASSTPSQLDSTRKGRYIITIGFLNLRVGSWHDALRRLSEGATLAQESGDSMWQAKAIEGILVSMLLLAWKNVDFEIPNVCQRAYRTSQLLARSPFNISPAPAHASFDADDSGLEPVRKLLKFSPAVIQATFDLYTSLASRSNQTLSSTVLKQARIRLVNLLILIRRPDMVRDTKCLTAFVLGNGQHLLRASGEGLSSKVQLSNNLLELVPSADELAGDDNAFGVLAAILASLLLNGSVRRYVLTLSQLLKNLASALKRARQLGASESGVHLSLSTLPGTGAISNESKSSRDGFRSFLQAATRICGLQVDFTRDTQSDSSHSDDITKHLLSWVRIRQDGDVPLKFEVLQRCINVADSVPDLEASMALSSMLLRTATRTLTISTLSDGERPYLSPEEQTGIVEGLQRNASAVIRLGAGEMLADYWDDFLIRDIQVYQPPAAAKLTSHTPNDLSAVSAQPKTSSRDPFIFNPFARGTSLEATPVIVAEELVTFSVVLQNPLEVEIEVDDIALDAEGCDFVANPHSMVLGPFCTQTFSLTGRARTSGLLEVRGCYATVAGCRKRPFNIFKDNWRPPYQPKIKPFLRHDLQTGHKRNVSNSDEPDIRPPQSSIVQIKVIDPQPQLEIAASSLIKPSLMLLDGETKTFELILKNQSAMLNDLLLFSYSDNVTTGLAEALSRKDLTMAETHEIQYQLTSKPTLTAQDHGDRDHLEPINAGGTAKFNFDIYGRPGLLDAAVQIDFAYLGVPRSELQEMFYTRHTSFPIAVTVNGTIDIPRCNILPVGNDFVWPTSNQTTTKSNGTNGAVTRNSSTAFRGRENCILSLDLRNVWPQPLIASLITRTNTAEPADQEADDTYTSTETLQPGQVTRVMLVIPRLFIQNPDAPIPNLIAQRQFVVSNSKLSAEAEAASREVFWYREELLKHVTGSWREEKTGRHGEIDLRKAIRLNSRMIDVLKIDHVNISFFIRAKSSDHVKQLGENHFSIVTETFATLVVRVHNRSTDKLALLLRLQPSLREQPHNIALDLSRRFAWSGTLQQAMYPGLEPGDIHEAELGITPLAEGMYEVNATVEEIKGRAKSKSSAGPDGLATAPERRIWHARSPCLIDVVDVLD